MRQRSYVGYGSSGELLMGKTNGAPPLQSRLASWVKRRRYSGNPFVSQKTYEESNRTPNN